MAALEHLKPPKITEGGFARQAVTKEFATEPQRFVTLACGPARHCHPCFSLRLPERSFSALTLGMPLAAGSE
jgi:hypothetical protein